MHLSSLPLVLVFLLARSIAAVATSQLPLLRHAASNRAVSSELFADLEELARVVDISYCVGLANTGISKPFQCLSRCAEFPDFELVTTWNTGQLMSDSCGYIALSHRPDNPRIIVAFRGSYSLANIVADLSTVPQEYAPYPGSDSSAGDGPKCDNCSVHSGFFTAWKLTSSIVNLQLDVAIAAHPGYKLTLVGHSLGGAIAALAGLDFVSRGWDPTVTTFGEPRLGNAALMSYLDARFNLQPASRSNSQATTDGDMALRYRRVTHMDDPVPQLPLSEWGYRPHAGEIYISKSALFPHINDLQHCNGDEDAECIAGQDPTLFSAGLGEEAVNLHELEERSEQASRAGAPWTMPIRYRLWQMLFAHRDYFWRLGLCVPGGDPWDWGRKAYAQDL